MKKKPKKNELMELCLKFSDSKRMATIVYNGLGRGNMYFGDVPPVRSIEDLKKLSIDDAASIRNVGAKALSVIDNMIKHVTNNDKPIEEKDYSTTCNKDDNDESNPCFSCTRFCFPIGCMLNQDMYDEQEARDNEQR